MVLILPYVMECRKGVSAVVRPPGVPSEAATMSAVDTFGSRAVPYQWLQVNVHSNRWQSIV